MGRWAALGLRTEAGDVARSARRCGCGPQSGKQACVRNGLVEGVSLRAVLRESGAMAPEAAASVLAGTLLTLAGVHGDVRPENVLVDASGGLTLTGFGAPDPEFTPDEPTYLAPERATGGPATPAAE